MLIDWIGMPQFSVYFRGYTLIRNARVVFCSKWVRHWNGSWQDPLRSISGCSFYFQQQAPPPPSQASKRLLVAQGDCAAIGYIAGIFHSSTADVVFHAHGHCVPCMSRASFSGSGGRRRGGGGGAAAKLAQASQGWLTGRLVGYVGDWKREGEHFPLLANAPKRPNNFRARRNLCSNSGESRCFYGNSW